MKVIDVGDRKQSNRDSYDDLMVSIEAGQGDLNLLLAVCDDQNYRDRLIEDYEKELITEGIRPYRLTINPKDPSLYDTLSRQFRSDDYLQQAGKAVLTVTGAEGLLALKLGEARSPLAIFINYLQYTREGLRDFPFPVVLWLSNQVHDEIAKRAIDFYSWRKGVFFFTAESVAIVEPHPPSQQKELSFTDIEQKGVGMLKVEDLQVLIAHKSGEPDESLATLYASLGDAYKQRLDSGQSTDYQADLTSAIAAWEKVAKLQEDLNSDIELATTLNNLALLYRLQGRYSEAKPLYLRSLSIVESQLGADHPYVATSLNNLAALYRLQGRYSEAEPLHLRSLSIRESQLGADHPDIAQSLNNLANLYQSQGRYSEAEPLFLRSQSIDERIYGADHPNIAADLNNLANLYQSQGRYSEAEPLYLRSLSIVESQLGADHPYVATSLNNLAALYRLQGRYSEAEPLYLRSLQICEQRLEVDHPTTITVRQNYDLFLAEWRSQHKNNAEAP